MDRVQRNESVSLLNLGVNNHEVVDVIKILAYPFCGNIGMYATYNEVASSSAMDLACNMSRKNELTFIP